MQIMLLRSNYIIQEKVILYLFNGIITKLEIFFIIGPILLKFSHNV